MCCYTVAANCNYKMLFFLMDLMDWPPPFSAPSRNKNYCCMLTHVGVVTKEGLPEFQSKLTFYLVPEVVYIGRKFHEAPSCTAQLITLYQYRANSQYRTSN